MLRRTKIVATLGPATDDPKCLDKLLEAGVDVVRLNLSHGTPEEHKQRADLVRNRARAHGRQVGVLADLQGPKIRIERFADGPVLLEEGASFALDASCPADGGDSTRVGITFKPLPNDVGRGSLLPTTSVEQYAGTLAKWFGVPDSDMTSVVPRAGNWSNLDLGFMNAA
jgi:pyruvate kinase